MNLKSNLILLLFFMFCSNVNAQWTYDEYQSNRGLIINYSVTYENELTEKQKKSSSYIKEIVVIIQKHCCPIKI